MTFRPGTFKMIYLFALLGILIFSGGISYASTDFVDSAGSCGGYLPCYTSIQSAIDGASADSEIDIASEEFPEVITMNRPLTLTLSGGWNTDFTGRSSATTSYSMTIENGTVIADGLVLGLHPYQVWTYPIVDTAQTTFYGNTSELSTTPSSPSNAFYGQDAQYSGLEPSYQDNGDGTVTDLNTGLMWVQARGDKISWADAVAGATTCTAGGYTDWRMPTIKELYSLIEFTGNLGTTDATSIPYIDTNYFEIKFGDTDSSIPNTAVGNRVIDGQDWSGTEYVSTTMKNSQNPSGDATVFGVNFIDGRIKGYPITDDATNSPNMKYVRYVRGNANYGKNQFVDNSDETITDKATGLMWTKEDSGSWTNCPQDGSVTGEMNWEDALACVQIQNAADYLGYSDWRLPDAKELQSIVDYDRSPDTTGSAAIDPVFDSTPITNEGGYTDYPFYWTGTTHVEYSTSNEACYLSFGRALGWMEFGTDTYYTLVDAHGAGAQRSDPKSGSYTDYPLGTDINGNEVYGRGPQGDVVRINNFVRLVRNAD